MSKQHIVLIGDSIFDNAAYVPGKAPVIKQLKSLLENKAKATLCAVDGHTSMEIPVQIESIPDDATHLVLSVGGNDALIWRNELLSTKSALDALTLLRKAQREFEQSYGEAVDAAISTGMPLEVCTIYKHIPGLPDILQAPLGVFNDVITQTINGYGNIGLIDLRYICTEPEDYSDMSPIEPSAKGGMKIAKAIVNRLLDQQIKQPDHTSMNAENRQNR